MRYVYYHYSRHPTYSPCAPQLLSKSEHALLGHQITHSILDKIDAILFATDYNNLGPNAKTRWIRTRFFEESKHFDAALAYNVNITRLNNPEHKKHYDQWRKTLQHSTTGRNRLLNLYKFVSPFVYQPIVIY